MTRRFRFLLAFAAVLALVSTGCGTRVDKQAYYKWLAQFGSQSNTSAGGGTYVDGGTGGGGTNPTTGPTSSGGGTGGGGTGSSSVSGLSTTVVGKTITIGFHVPITGAAPLPTNFTDIIKMVEEYFNAEAKVYGRGVHFIIEDDGYDATVGLAACKKIYESNPLFVIGHTMPAAEDACARFFGERKIPYFIRGTYPDVLNNRPLTWAGSTSDDIQGKLLADFILHQRGAASKKSAIVYQNDQTAAYRNFKSEILKNGGKVVVEDQCVPRQQDFSATIQKLQQSGAQFVLASMPPVDAIKLTIQAQGQGYHPTWLGGGSWWNYNMSLESAGMAMDGAIVFSPWPSIDSAAATTFKQTFKKYRPNGTPDDIGLIIWGWANLARQILMNAGQQLSRASFVQAANNTSFSPPYWVPINYRNGYHRGANSVAVFQGDGQAKRWRQISGFASSF